MAYRRSIQHLLVFYVSIALLILSLISGATVYLSAFDKEIAAADLIEQQLVATVKVQAEVAVYANNSDIADGVIEGLRATPRILFVKIVGNDDKGFKVGAEQVAANGEATTREYSLFSPVDRNQPIGVLSVTRNDELIRAEAAANSLRQTAMMVGQVFVTALLIIVFSHILIGRPVTELADQLAKVKPGDGIRIQILDKHQHDEIGSLSKSANALIQAAEDALDEVRAMATQDALTGLPNRRAFIARIDEEHARIKRYEHAAASVLMLDIDHFKQINDQYGHGGGDAVLRYFGALLAGELRRVDFAGRIGGEEFAVLLPATGRPDSVIFAERMRKITEQATIPYNGTNLTMTVSIGIATMDSTSGHFEDALEAADKALYQAKHAGRNRVAGHSPDSSIALLDNASPLPLAQTTSSHSN